MIYKHTRNRTFLAWLHVVVMLAGASVTIVTFSEAQGIAEQLFGVVLLPVSVAYIFYALSQCKLIVLKVHFAAYYDNLVKLIPPSLSNQM